MTRELVLQLGEARRGPLFLRIARAIVEDIERGRLRPGERLPSSRELAAQLGVHRKTVVAGFLELARQGWVTSTPAVGTYVSGDLPDKLPPFRQRALADRAGFDLPRRPLPAPASTPRAGLLLLGGVPELGFLPRLELARAYRRALLGGVATPPFFTTNAGGKSFFTTLVGSGNPVVVSDEGEAVVIDDVRSRRGFFAPDGVVVYTAQTEGGLELRRAQPGDGPSRTTLADKVAGVYTVLAGSQAITGTWTSPDGSKLPYFTQVDPATGFADLALADVRDGRAPQFVDAQPRNVLGGPPFSADSEHFLFARVVDLARGTAPLFASGDDGVRQFSDEGGWSYLPAFGSFISFNDNALFDAEDFSRSTADVRAVDLSRKALKPRLIAPQANLTYFGSHDGRRVAFTTDRVGTTAGLYSAKVND